MTRSPGRRAALRAFVLLLGGPGALAQADDRPSITAAMRLAVLAERIAKLQVQAAQGVSAERGPRALAEATREFESGLRAIAARVPGTEARDNYLLLQILWEDLRAFSAEPAAVEGRRLAERVDEVAWIAAKGARLLHPGGADSLAMRASRACVLSQRVPRLALLGRGERGGELGREFARALEALRELLDQLASAPLNTAETAGEVQVARTQFGFMERAAGEMERVGARAAENVAKTGDHILEAMARAAPLYEAAGV